MGGRKNSWVLARHILMILRNCHVLLIILASLGLGAASFANTNLISHCSDLLLKLDWRMQNATEEIERLKKDDSYILDVIGFAARDSGARLSGLYRVKTPAGDKILKLYGVSELWPLRIRYPAAVSFSYARLNNEVGISA